MIGAEEAYKMTSDLVQKRIKRIQSKINKKIKRLRYNIYDKQYELFVSWQNPRNVDGVAFETDNPANGEVK